MNYFISLFLKAHSLQMSKYMEMFHYKHIELEQRATMMNFMVTQLLGVTVAHYSHLVAAN